MTNNAALYSLPKYYTAEGKADQAFWMKDLVIILLVVGLSALDAVTLYTVFDSVMYQSQILSLVLTMGCAVSLNFIPLLMARFIHCYRYHINGVKLWMIISMAVVFLILFCATFYLRWETREFSFAGAESSMVDSTGQALGVAGTDGDSNEAVAITILLGIMPGITSAINLALGYFNDDPVKRKLLKMKCEVSRLRDQESIMRAARVELDQEWKSTLTDLDLQRFQTKCDAVKMTTDRIKTLARLELAKKLRDADSISALTEPRMTGDET